MNKRGEIWWVNLDPTIGAEIKKTRPCIVVSSNLINEFSPVILVIPLSSKAPKSPSVLRVKIESPGTGLEKTSWASANQLRAVDVRRFREKAGNVNAAELAHLEEALKVVLELF
jgi:mRNA interferase MazF